MYEYLDPTTFTFKNSRAQDIYNVLKQNGIDVYFPGQHVGDCTSPYVVVKNDGSYKHVKMSTDRDMYSIMCFVPLKSYSSLEPLVQTVKSIMRTELYPMIRIYGQQMPSYYDDTKKAHYISIEYENYKKIF